MPLAFESTSHGTVAFGFFNIESDMLLLEHWFFFADGFCEAVGALAGSDVGAFEANIPAYDIESPGDIGDLMGAIHGIRFTGFIGDTYRRYPFPERPEDFKQKPEGCETRDDFREMIGKYAAPSEVSLVAGKEEVSIGEYRFEPRDFLRLVSYVWAGGYPRWRGEERPACVQQMRDAIEKSSHPLFEGYRP